MRDARPLDCVIVSHSMSHSLQAVLSHSQSHSIYHCKAERGQTGVQEQAMRAAVAASIEITVRQLSQQQQSRSLEALLLAHA